MRAATCIIALFCLLAPGCVVGRILQGNLAAPPERPAPHVVRDPRRSDARLSALWVGHATVLLQLDDLFVLTDPVFMHTLTQVSSRLVAPGIDPKDVPPLAAVVVSHMHFDHLSLASLDLLQQKTPIVLVPPGVRSNMPRYAFEIRELSSWVAYEAGGLRVTAVPVQHVGGRYGIDRAFSPRAFTGYVLEYHGLAVYFAGDTAYAPEAFMETRRRFPHLDLALLPIGPIEPRAFMARTHVDPSQALDAFGLLGARTMLPIHFDTFVNSYDRPGACAAELRRQMSARALGDDRVTILEIGEQRVFVPREPRARAP